MKNVLFEVRVMLPHEPVNRHIHRRTTRKYDTALMVGLYSYTWVQPIRRYVDKKHTFYQFSQHVLNFSNFRLNFRFLHETGHQVLYKK